MKKKTQRFTILFSIVLALLLLSTGLTLAQDSQLNLPATQAPLGTGTSTALSTDFTYQGRLTDEGAPSAPALEEEIQSIPRHQVGQRSKTQNLETLVAQDPQTNDPFAGNYRLVEWQELVLTWIGQDEALHATVYDVGSNLDITPTGAQADLDEGFIIKEDSQDIALGDLDGDGDLDAVVANYSNSAETVWINDGSGRLWPHPDTPTFGAGQSLGISLGDLDGDGDLDAIVANDNEPQSIWLNDGAGGFSPNPTQPSFGGGHSCQVALGDLDGDGDLDAIVANYGGWQYVWLNNGTAVFTSTSSFHSDGLDAECGIALDDLDGDNDLDVLMVNGYPGTQSKLATVWKNGGSGNFSWSTDIMILEPIVGGIRVRLADVNNDNHPDAIISREGGEKSIWLNLGGGIFPPLPSSSFNDSAATSAFALEDLDGDNDPDLVLANAGNEANAVYLNNGSGVFYIPPLPIPSTFGAGDSTALALGDLDGDGDADALIANFDQPESAWLNDGAGAMAAHPDAFHTNPTDSDIAPGDLNGDGKIDIATIWDPGNGTIKMLTQSVDASLQITATSGTLTQVTTMADGFARSATGDLDGDGKEEAIVAWAGDDSNVQLRVYQFDQNLAPTIVDEIADETWEPWDAPGGERLAGRGDVTTGDLDGDGIDEIILLWSQTSGATPQYGLKVYRLEDGVLQPGAALSVDAEHNLAQNMAVAVGDYNNDSADEIAIAYYGVTRPSSTYQIYAYLKTYALANDALQLDNSKDLGHYEGYLDTDIGLAVSDLDFDGTSELVLAYLCSMTQVRADVFTASDLEIVARTPVRPVSTFSLAVGDLNLDLEPEIALVSHDSPTLYKTQIYAVDTLGTPGDPALIPMIDEVIQPNVLQGAVALASGDLDDDGARVGPPKYYYESDVTQVLAVINMPPVHHDVLDDGTEIVVNICDDPNVDWECNSRVVFGTQQTSTEMSLSVLRTWSYDNDTKEMCAGDCSSSHFTYSLENTYGKNFELSAQAFKEMSIGQEVWAARDDVIIRTQTDYDVWEYPLYISGTQQVEGHILVTWPRIKECDQSGCTASVKTIVGGLDPTSSYKPYHEPRNILSYPDLSNPLQNFCQENLIASLAQQQVGSSGPTSWSVDMTAITTSHGVSSIEATTFVGYEYQVGGQENSAEVSAEPFGIGVAASYSYKQPYFKHNLTGSYGLDAINTFEVSFQEDTSINILVGSLTGEATRFPYQLRPYAYWSNVWKMLTVDFSAAPVVSPGNGWDEYYNQPDPAFNLPWRYGDLGETWRQHTKEIGLPPGGATVAESVPLTATVHNYGLQGVQQPIDLAFFLPSDYALTVGQGGLLRTNFVSDPTDPSQVGTFNLPDNVAAYAVTTGDEVAYIGDENGLWLVDIAKPDEPAQRSFYDPPQEAPALGVALNTRRIDTNEDGNLERFKYAYVAAGESGLRIVDVTQPDQPTEVGAYEYTDTTPGYVPGSAQNVVAAKCRSGATQMECAFVAEAPVDQDGVQVGGGLRILNIADPAVPLQISFLNLGQAVNSLALPEPGGFAYLATDNGLIVVDVSDALRPKTVGSLSTPSPALDVAISGRYAYLAAGGAGLRVVNISSRSHPVEADAYTALTAAAQVQATPDTVYVADTNAGLVILDTSAGPGQIQVAGSLPGAPTALALGLDMPLWHSGTPLEICRQTIGSINPLSTVDVACDWTPIEVGEYTIYGVIDPENNLINEVKESNNMGFSTIRVCPDGDVGRLCQGVIPTSVYENPGDVAPVEISLPIILAAPQEGDLVELSTSVQAITGTFTYVTVEFYLGDPESGGAWIGSQTITLLEEGQTAYARLLWDTQGVTPRTYDLYVKVVDQLGEGETSNNIISAPITLAPSQLGDLFLPLVVR